MSTEIENTLKTTVAELLHKMDVKADVLVQKQFESEDTYDIQISGNDLSFLIGARGHTLEDLQNVVNLILLRKTEVRAFTNIDINDYKIKKEEKLHEMVKRYIDKVRFFQKPVELPAMSPWERRLIHMFVREYPDVMSESTGEGQDRHIVLSNKE